ncbi:Gx transporter family protein [Anaeromicrobium sediminis]|uniref:Heptaprenyl diphosphate synthase n=1 Tax=Anaeromicrobium sediminis TaxID=1478221 RepID=A0A267MP49_9FIRM|nr:Gx transporter family protein [Anaeromicrobium sediminis]PAB61379.1 heptaprenyl diphosphate synthase [Anaeromicrobium sediminis]
MRTRKLLYLSLITAIGIGLQIVENFIPVNFVMPGAKLGLANISNLVTLVVFGFKNALIVSILRTIVGTLGSGAVTGFFYSFSGAISSTIAMWIMYKNFNKYFSLIGVSIVGALFHNMAQVLVASIMINNWLIFTYLPFMMLTSLFTGCFIGLSSNYISKHLNKIIGKERLYE